MPLYKQWSITHYTFDVIVLTSSEKLFSRLHHRIFQIIYLNNLEVEFHSYPYIITETTTSH